MLIAALIALATVAGAPPATIAIGAALAIEPLVAAVCLVGWAVYARARSAAPGVSAADETALFLGLAGELRAGTSLRAAVGAAAGRAPAIDLVDATRLASIGAPADAVADRLQRALPTTGRLAGPAFRLAAESGARAAAVFEVLAARASELAELKRSTRALTAQARLSAAVVGGAPLVLFAVLAATGRAGTLVDSGPVGWTMAAVGVALEVAGLAAVVLIVRRASAP